MASNPGQTIGGGGGGGEDPRTPSPHSTTASSVVISPPDANAAAAAAAATPVAATPVAAVSTSLRGVPAGLKVLVNFRATGSAPIMKKTKFTLSASHRFGMIIDWL